MQNSKEKSKVWYKEPWPWLLMVGPAIVVVAGFSTFYIARKSAPEMVTDDYYKEGKYISIELKRDEAAIQRHINGQVLISPNMDTAKVLLSGDFDRKAPLNLIFLHPAKKSGDQVIVLKPTQDGVASGDKTEYLAVFKTLPQVQHWYVRVEDANSEWRVEDKWIVSQGNAINLTPMNKLLGDTPQNP